MNAEKLKSILEKYARPENCPGMTCKKVNPEIWKLLNSSRKRTDVQLYHLQQTVLKVMFAVLQTTNTLVESSSNMGNNQILANLIDAIAMLAHTHSNMLLLRKDQIKPALKQEYSAICDLEDQPDSKLLFGNELAKNLEEDKEASHLSSSMKSFTTKPHSANKKPASTYKQGHSYSNRNFLCQGQQRNKQRKKTLWKGGAGEEMVDLLKQLKNSVSEFEKHIPIINNYLQSLSKNFRAGRVAQHFPAWAKITSDKGILAHITGVEIECTEEPVQTGPPGQKFLPHEHQILDGEIAKLVDKGVIQKVQQEGKQFISNIFLRLKPDGTHHLILNLKEFNESVVSHHFKMDSIYSITKLVTKTALWHL